MDVGDEEVLAAHAAALADAIDAALEAWVVRVVRDRAEAWQAGSFAALAEAAARAGEAARGDVGARVRSLLTLDVDEQRTSPLALVREAVRYPTAVLAEAGVAPVRRDEFRAQAFPEDRYDLAPAAFADLSADVHEPGLVWGAAKAHVVLARRRASGPTG